MNTIVLIGRLARNPETKLASTQKGQTKVSRFPLVVKRNRTRCLSNSSVMVKDLLSPRLYRSEVTEF